MCACTVTCELAAKLVNNPPRENLTTKIDVSVVNSDNYLKVENTTKEEYKQSVYKFSLTVPAEISSFCKYEWWCKLVSVALSMLNPGVLFSETQNSYLEQSVNKPRKKPKDPLFNNTPDGKSLQLYEIVTVKEQIKIEITASPIEINEREFLEILKGLLNIFKKDGDRTLFEGNIVEAINNYINALNGNNKEHFFKFLYIALEKAANADKDRVSDEFDRNVSELTHADKEVISKYRLLNDRVKHSFRNEKDREIYKSFFKTIDIQGLKEIVDTAIKYRIKKHESGNIR